MTGGKSSSSSNQSSSTSTSTASATGTVGNVVQGQHITINDEFGDNVAHAYEQLLALAGQSIHIAADAGQAALEATNKLATETKQPDLALIQGYQKQVYYAIGAVAIVGVLFLWRKK